MAISERELEAARTARAVRTARADARAADLAPTIKELQASGATTLQAIAAELNRRGIPTATGRGEWCGFTGSPGAGAAAVRPRACRDAC
jgi:hypothetical protein